MVIVNMEVTVDSSMVAVAVAEDTAMTVVAVVDVNVT